MLVQSALGSGPFSQFLELPSWPKTYFCPTGGPQPPPRNFLRPTVFLSSEHTIRLRTYYLLFSAQGNPPSQGSTPLWLSGHRLFSISLSHASCEGPLSPFWSLYLNRQTPDTLQTSYIQEQLASCHVPHCVTGTGSRAWHRQVLNKYLWSEGGSEPTGFSHLKALPHIGGQRTWRITTAEPTRFQRIYPTPLTHSWLN